MFNLIPKTEAPHLYAEWEALCAKAGLASAPPIVTPTELFMPGNPLRDWAVAAIKLTNDQDCLLLPDKAAEALGLAARDGHMTDALKGVLAHEIKHFKHDFNTRRGLTTVLAMQSSPFIGALAALGGYALYRHIAAKRPADLPEDQIKAHDSAQLDEHIKTAKKAGVESSFLKIAKYSAAGALGIIAGSLAGKAFFNHMEYGADAFSKQLLGSGEPLAKGLEIMKEPLSKIMPEMPFLLRGYDWMMHPNIDARIARLRA